MQVRDIFPKSIPGRFALFLNALPAVIALLYIHVFGVNVVFFDQWSVVSHVLAFTAGEMPTLEYVFSQHSVHRFAFSRLTQMLLAPLTGYNSKAEMFISWILLSGTVVLVGKLYLDDRETDEASPSWRALISALPITWMLFTLKQHGNLLWGWQIHVYLTLFGFVGAIAALDYSHGVDRTFAFSLLAGFVATFNYASGLLVWPAGLLYLLASRSGRLRAVCWSAFSLGVYTLYFYSWETSNSAPAYFLTHPADAVLYTAMATGAPVSYGQLMSALVGAFWIGLFALVALVGLPQLRRNAKWYSMAAFGFGYVFMLLGGRLHKGFESALWSRYISITVFTFIAGYAIARNVRTDVIRRPLYWSVTTVLVLGILVGYAGGGYAGTLSEDKRVEEACIALNYETVSNERLSELHHNTTLVRENLRELERRDMNVFANPGRYDCG